MDFIFRKAKISDIDDLERLITQSARSINSAFYSKIEIDAALGNAWTVDEQRPQELTDAVGSFILEYVE